MLGGTVRFAHAMVVTMLEPAHVPGLRGIVAELLSAAVSATGAPPHAATMATAESRTGNDEERIRFASVWHGAARATQSAQGASRGSDAERVPR